MSAALIERGRALRSPPKPPPASPPPDYLAPFLPPSQSALAPPSLSASLLFSPSPSHLLTSSYLQQRRRHYSPSAWSSLLSSLSTTTTLYLGNLSFTTREETVHHFFSSAGPIHSLYMGLNAHTHHPCGFCFIRFRTAEGARRARWTLSGMKVDGRVCGVDFDQEFRAGRQWGRGKTGGQIRDDHRSSYDEGRGGWGLREKLKQQQRRMQDEQVTQFKPIREGEEEKTGGEEEADSGSGQVQLKREKGSYKEAHALRKAGAAAITASAVEAGVKQEGMEEKAEDEPASKRRRVQEAEEKEAEPRERTMQQGGEEGESSADPWSTAHDGEMADPDAGEDAGEQQTAEEGNAQAWGGDGDRQGETSGHSSREDARRAGEEEEEVEHGFAAQDEETADPQWS